MHETNITKVLVSLGVVFGLECLPSRVSQSVSQSSGSWIESETYVSGDTHGNAIQINLRRLGGRRLALERDLHLIKFKLKIRLCTFSQRLPGDMILYLPVVIHRDNKESLRRYVDLFNITTPSFIPDYCPCVLQFSVLYNSCTS